MTRLPRFCAVCLVAIASACGGGGGDPYGLGPLPPPIPAGDAVTVSGRWVASRDLHIALYDGPSLVRVLTDSPYHDYKPVWSPDSDRIVFFRALRDSGAFSTWLTKLCVVNADGTGFRELTDGTHRDFNPTWARDGSHRILFNRYAETSSAQDEVYATTPDASPGDEVKLDGRGAALYEWVNAGLPDGRLVVDWSFLQTGSATQRTFLLTPGPGGGYEELSRPSYGYWHKLSVSPSLTRVAYMVDLARGSTSGDYSDDVLYWAELDVDGRAITSPVLITRPTGGLCTNEYPRWSPDETMVVFDSSCVGGTGRAYAYRLADGAVFPISDDPHAFVQFVDFEHTPQ